MIQLELFDRNKWSQQSQSQKMYLEDVDSEYLK